MERRNLCRIISTVETAAWGYFGYGCCNILSHIDYNLLLADDLPERKIAKVVYAGALCLAVPIIAFGIADGVSGIVKGACGYLALKSLQRSSKDSETRDDIDSFIKNMRGES